MTIFQQPRRVVSSLIGLGSNVVDEFTRVKALPRGSGKYFVDTNKFGLDSRTHGNISAGGVVLNQLAWAKALYRPSDTSARGAELYVAIIAKQGTEENRGKWLRHQMENVGIDDSLVHVDPAYRTAYSYVFVDAAHGDRSIVMNKGSTADLHPEDVLKSWDLLMHEHSQTETGALNSQSTHHRVFGLTEISQVNLDSVVKFLHLVKSGKRYDRRDVQPKMQNMAFLDIDIPPSSALSPYGEADLGSWRDFKLAVHLADITKISREAALELDFLMTHAPRESSSIDQRLVENAFEHAHRISSLQHLDPMSIMAELSGAASRLRRAFHSKMLIITSGTLGTIVSTSNEFFMQPLGFPTAQSSSSGDHAWVVPAITSTRIIDTTGAGDAFYGCFIAETLMVKGGIEALQSQDIHNIAHRASAAAVTCCETWGAFPPRGAHLVVDDTLKRVPYV